MATTEIVGFMLQTYLFVSTTLSLSMADSQMFFSFLFAVCVPAKQVVVDVRISYTEPVFHLARLVLSENKKQLTFG